MSKNGINKSALVRTLGTTKTQMWSYSGGFLLLMLQSSVRKYMQLILKVKLDVGYGPDFINRKFFNETENKDIQIKLQSGPFMGCVEHVNPCHRFHLKGFRNSNSRRI